MQRRLVPSFITINLCGFLLLGNINIALSQEKIQPRVPLVSPELVLIPESKQRLTIKFKDHIKARAQSNGSVASRTGITMSTIATLRSKYKLQFRPLIKLPEDKLTRLEKRAETLSRRAQPDLNGMMIVELPGASGEQLIQVGEELKALDVVEYVYLESLLPPPPGDISPVTPNLRNFQTYFNTDPGMDADYAWSLGYTGGGVRLSDCEYGWVYSHEDLVDKNLHPEANQTPDPFVAANNWDEHGTAVMGEICGVPNTYGVSGMVPDASIYTYPEFTVEDGARRAASITNAIANSSAGDIVLLEMQTGLLVPAETDPSVYAVVKAGVDAGVIVVAAAGNGDQDLDGMNYETYMSWGGTAVIGQ